VRVQERDLKTFHEGLKQDTKLMKQSVDMLPKDLRKDVLRQRKEEKDIEQAEKVTDELFTVSWDRLLLYELWSVWALTLIHIFQVNLPRVAPRAVSKWVSV